MDLWPWLVLALAAVVVSGLPGRTTDVFLGDLAYHRAVALSMSPGDLNGSGPYEGLPSYYGGLFPIAWALAGGLGLDHEVVLSVVSWCEPALWVAAAAVLAAALWPGRRWAQLGFAGLVVGSAGIGLPHGQRWVDAPNLAGHVFWPLYPRDVAMMALMVAVAAALRRRPVVAGVVVGLAVAVQLQVGALAGGLCLLALATSGLGVRGLRRDGVVLAVAAALSSAWWWVPRAWWVARWGVDLAGYSGRADVPATPSTFARAFGIVLPVAAVGLVAVLRRRGGRVGFLAWWAGLAVAMMLGALAAGGDVLALRRALYFATLPVAGLAVEGSMSLAERVRRPSARALAPVAPVALAVLAVATSVPTLAATRSFVDGVWPRAAFAAQDYSGPAWSEVWSAARGQGAPVLVPERDATMLWFATGRTVLWMNRPGPVKAGFDVGAATGWSEANREEEVNGAFARGRPALCDLAVRRGAATLVLRAQPGLVAWFDLPLAARYRQDPSDEVGRVVDKNPYDELVVARGGRVPVPFEGSDAVARLEVWWRRPRQAAADDLGILLADGTRLSPDATRREAGLTVSSFDLAPGAAPGATIVNSGPAAALGRVAGYLPDPSADAPAVVLGVADACPAG
ncbi:MAG: hypothetical protein AB7L84_12705 [Acidimicrobiia bacterium]